MFLVNSRSHLVFATGSSSGGKPLHRRRHTFSRSYGVILPSSFTRVLSSASVCSTQSPVSVYGTVACCLKLRGFSWKHGISDFAGTEVPASSSRLRMAFPDFPGNTPYALEPRQPTLGSPSLLRPPIAATSGTGILTCFPSATHFCLALGADSPCVD